MSVNQSVKIVVKLFEVATGSIIVKKKFYEHVRLDKVRSSKD